MRYKVGPSKLLKGELGVFATKQLDEDDIVGFMSGVELDPKDEFDHTHILWMGELPILVTNELKYVNHHKNSNCHLEGLILYASRRIKRGEELFWDYGEEFEKELTKDIL